MLQQQGVPIIFELLDRKKNKTEKVAEDSAMEGTRRGRNESPWEL